MFFATPTHRRTKSGRKPHRVFHINGNSPQAVGLVSWMPFTHNTYDAAQPYDLIIRRRLHTVIGTPVGGQDPHGKLGWCGEFDGSTDGYYRGQLPPGIHDGTNPWSVTCWCRPRTDHIGTPAGIVDRNSTAHYAYLGVQTGGDVRFVCRGGGAAKSAVVDSFYSPYDLLFIVGIWVSATDKRVYVNGPANTATNTNSITPTGIDGHSIGVNYRSSPVDYFDGWVGDVRYYNRQLTESEIYHMWAPATRWDLYRKQRPPFFLNTVAPPTTVIPVLMQGYRRRRV